MDRHTSAPIRLKIPACRHTGLTDRIATTAMTVGTPTRSSRWSGRGAAGKRGRSIVARVGRARPRRNIAAAMMTNGRPAATPGNGSPPAVGNQLIVWR